MTTPQAIKDLISLIENGEGPDRELDASILCAVLAPEGSKIEQSPINGAWCIYEPMKYGKKPFRLWETPFPWRKEDCSLTGSLDAAIALTEKLLPGVSWSVSRHGASVSSSEFCEVARIENQPPRALLAATLRAKLAELEGDQQ